VCQLPQRWRPVVKTCRFGSPRAGTTVTSIPRAANKVTNCDLRETQVFYQMCLGIARSLPTSTRKLSHCQ
jgi:hypothetical protein